VLDAVVVQLHSTSFNLVAIAAQALQCCTEDEIWARRLLGADTMPSGANPVFSKTRCDFSAAVFLLQICKIVLIRDFKFRNVVSSQVERYPFHPRGKCVQGVHDSLGWMMKSFKGIHMIGSRLDPRN
jgi:hypothetical protein